jgi:hypothetical protein
MDTVSGVTTTLQNHLINERGRTDAMCIPNAGDESIFNPYLKFDRPIEYQNSKIIFYHGLTLDWIVDFEVLNFLNDHYMIYDIFLLHRPLFHSYQLMIFHYV